MKTEWIVSFHFFSSFLLAHHCLVSSFPINVKQRRNTNPSIRLYPLSASVINLGEQVSDDEINDNDDDDDDDAHNLRYTRFGGVGR
jgi:hypothetical protein